MMARPQELIRRPWTKEEDEKLFECRSRNEHLSWPDVAVLAGLARTGKSCRERWNNCLSPHVNRGDFSQEEDDTIISLQRLYGNKWATIATHLPGRTDNAIKNRWNNHINRRLTRRSIDENFPDPHATVQLLHPNDNFNPSASSSSIPTPISSWGHDHDSDNSLFVGPGSLIPHFFPNDTHFNWTMSRRCETSNNPNETNSRENYFDPRIPTPEMEFMPTDQVTGYWSPPI